MYINETQLNQISKYAITKYHTPVYAITEKNHDIINNFCNFMGYGYVRSERRILTNEGTNLYISITTNNKNKEDIIKAGNYYTGEKYNITRITKYINYFKSNFKTRPKARLAFDFLLN